VKASWHFTDVTAARNSRPSCANRRQVLRNIVDTMADVLIITDLNGTVHQVNSPSAGCSVIRGRRRSV